MTHAFEHDQMETMEACCEFLKSTERTSSLEGKNYSSVFASTKALLSPRAFPETHTKPKSENEATISVTVPAC